MLDDFSGTLSGWTTPAYGNQALLITAGQVGSNVAGWGSGQWNAGTVGPDSEAFVTLATTGANGQEIGLHVRDSASGSSRNNYQVNIVWNTGAYILYRCTGTTFTNLKSGTRTLAAGDGLGLQMIGTRLALWHKPGAGAWTEVDSVTNGDHTVAGSIGLEVFGNTARLDDFGGGTFVPELRTLHVVSGIGRW